MSYAEGFSSVDEVHGWYLKELDLVESALRSGAPTLDPSSRFFGMPPDDFREELSRQRDEIENWGYFAVITVVEAIVQSDFRARAAAKRSTRLRDEAKRSIKAEKKHGARVYLEDILDHWKGAGVSKIGEFKQLLGYRHWLAHGRYFPRAAGVPSDPNFAVRRAKNLLESLQKLDPAFPVS